MLEPIVIIGLLILLLVREYLSFKERREMLDRLMAKDLSEFKDNQTVEENKFAPPDSGLEDVEQAQEEIINGPEEA